MVSQRQLHNVFTVTGRTNSDLLHHDRTAISRDSYLCYRNIVFNEMLNPQLGGLGDLLLSGLYPLTCPAWLNLPGAETPAGIALWVIETHKPLNHDKAPASMGLDVAFGMYFNVSAIV